MAEVHGGAAGPPRRRAARGGRSGVGRARCSRNSREPEDQQHRRQRDDEVVDRRVEGDPVARHRAAEHEPVRGEERSEPESRRRVAIDGHRIGDRREEGQREPQGEPGARRQGGRDDDHPPAGPITDVAAGVAERDADEGAHERRFRRFVPAFHHVVPRADAEEDEAGFGEAQPGQAEDDVQKDVLRGADDVEGRAGAQDAVDQHAAGGERDRDGQGARPAVPPARDAPQLEQRRAPRHGAEHGGNDRHDDLVWGHGVGADYTEDLRREWEET